MQTFLFKKVKNLKNNPLLYQINILKHIIILATYEHFGGQNEKAIGYIRVSTDEQAKEGMSLENQEAPVIHVNWAPPAGGDAELLELLEKLL